MSIVQSQTGSELHAYHAGLISGPVGSRVLHRVGEVRRQLNVSVRSLAHRMKTSEALIRQQEERTFDLPLTVLYKWQAALDVPLVELLIEPEPELSPHVKRRAALLKLMKTVRSMEQRVGSGPLRHLVQGLVGQLVDLMPELANVVAWPTVGKRRTTTEISPIEERVMPTGLLDTAWASGELE